MENALFENILVEFLEKDQKVNEIYIVLRYNSQDLYSSFAQRKFPEESFYFKDSLIVSVNIN
jgi:hypothetical protein